MQAVDICCTETNAKDTDGIAELSDTAQQRGPPHANLPQQLNVLL